MIRNMRAQEGGSSTTTRWRDATQWARELEHRDMQPQRGKYTDKTPFDDDVCESDVGSDERGSLVVGRRNRLQESRLFIAEHSLAPTACTFERASPAKSQTIVESRCVRVQVSTDGRDAGGRDLPEGHGSTTMSEYCRIVSR
jgi:hypothetical protein